MGSKAGLDMVVGRNISVPTTATRNWIQSLQSPNLYFTTYIELSHDVHIKTKAANFLCSK